MRRRLPPATRLAARLRLGAAIRNARRSVGLTQEVLGQRLGLKGRAIYRWERNETAPSGRHRRALIREIHLLNAQAGLDLQAAISKSTGKTYAVIDLTEEPVPQTTNSNLASTNQPFMAPVRHLSVVPASAQPGNDVLDIALLKMADELDLAPRRARRALARLLERLQSANFRLETIYTEIERLLARE